MATQATCLPWLARYAPADDTGRWIERTHKVADWSAVTDGKFILAIRDGGVTEYPPQAAPLYAGEKLRPFLEKEFQTLLTTTLGALWAFCGQIERGVCESCNGWGTVDYGTERTICPDCSQNGYYSPTCGDPRPAFVGDVLVNLDGLAYSLAPELAEIGQRVRVGRIESKKVKNAVSQSGDVLYLEEESGAWRVVLMGLDNPPNAERRPNGWGIVPTFHPEAVFANLWIEREGEARGVLADWLEERGDPFSAVLREAGQCLT